MQYMRRQLVALGPDAYHIQLLYVSTGTFFGVTGTGYLEHRLRIECSGVIDVFLYKVLGYL